MCATCCGRESYHVSALRLVDISITSTVSASVTAMLSMYCCMALIEVRGEPTMSKARSRTDSRGSLCHVLRQLFPGKCTPSFPPENLNDDLPFQPSQTSNTTLLPRKSPQYRPNSTVVPAW